MYNISFNVDLLKSLYKYLMYIYNIIYKGLYWYLPIGFWPKGFTSVINLISKLKIW